MIGANARRYTAERSINVRIVCNCSAAWFGSMPLLCHAKPDLQVISCAVPSSRSLAAGCKSQSSFAGLTGRHSSAQPNGLVCAPANAGGLKGRNSSPSRIAPCRTTQHTETVSLPLGAHELFGCLDPGRWPGLRNCAPLALNGQMAGHRLWSVTGFCAPP